MNPIGFQVTDLGHRFGNRWVFQRVNGQFEAGSHGVVFGSNGSGKSTLGRILTGGLGATKGNISWSDGSQEWDLSNRETLTLRTILMGPASALHPELTVSEACQFHGKFRIWHEGYDPLHALGAAGLTTSFHRPLKSLSSGMRQRVQLAIALGTSGGLICLDEPCANLDASGIQWYRELLQWTQSKTTTIICSNRRREDHLDPDWSLELPNP